MHIGTEDGRGGCETAGLIIHSDTFFSALFSEILATQGGDAAEGFLKLCRSGNLSFSSLLPYNADGCFVPKPVMAVRREVDRTGDSVEKKKNKKLKYIPAAAMDQYLSYLRKGTGGGLFFGKDVFGAAGLANKVMIAEEEGDNKLYTQAYYRFQENSGLYLAAACSDEAYFTEVFLSALESLGVSGLGGERSSGMGRFEACVSHDDGITLLAERAARAKALMCVSLLIPENAGDMACALGYSLIRRRGFIASEEYSPARKKLPLCAVGEGSCFSAPVCGSIADVAPPEGAHSVYRCGMPFYLGVE